MDNVKIGQQIALLRKEKGLTGDRLAELVGVSAQAVSKWENGRNLPESAVLPALARTLGCTIDTILIPQELVILEAYYSDGIESVEVTHTLHRLVRDNRLQLCVNSITLGISLASDRLKILTLKYNTPAGIFYAHAVQDEFLDVDISSTDALTNDQPFVLLGAYYGNGQEGGWNDAMGKMEHYEYFKWDKIYVNHETFPSNPASDEIEYLTLVYLNKDGIHVISCAENDILYYNHDRTAFYLQDNTKCILPGIRMLEWGKGRECCWAAAIHASLEYMGENYSYDEVMGLSGACYAVCFIDIWDWSCTDALVTYDFNGNIFHAVGYQAHSADRLEKKERRTERSAIVRDIQDGKPVIAINLRVAPEWGIICGYLDNGKKFLTRTFFDAEVFEEWKNEDCAYSDHRKLCYEEWGGYIINDFWPFLILHFGEKCEKAAPAEALRRSLETMIRYYHLVPTRGYHSGRDAYTAWIAALERDTDFATQTDRDGALRRLGVNESMLFHLVDARRAAEAYLRAAAVLLADEKREKILQIAEHYQSIHTMVEAFRQRVSFCCDTGKVFNEAGVTGVVTRELRQEQIALLRDVIALEDENVRLAEEILV